MELNKEYNVSDYPLEELAPGTIIKGLEYDCSPSLLNDSDNNLIVISERNGTWRGSNIYAVSLEDGEFYIENHSLIKYKIMKFPK